VIQKRLVIEYCAFLFALFAETQLPPQARQISLLDYGAFCCIDAEELQSQRWNKNPHLAPNVRHLITDFNRVSMWIAYCIVREYDAKTRVVVMSFLIDVGYQALKMGNFNAAMQTVGAFANSSIRRLKVRMFCIVLLLMFLLLHRKRHLLCPPSIARDSKS
jgi:hypothetical protein